MWCELIVNFYPDLQPVFSRIALNAGSNLRDGLLERKCKKNSHLTVYLCRLSLCWAFRWRGKCSASKDIECYHRRLGFIFRVFTMFFGDVVNLSHLSIWCLSLAMHCQLMRDRSMHLELNRGTCGSHIKRSQLNAYESINKRASFFLVVIHRYYVYLNCNLDFVFISFTAKCYLNCLWWDELMRSSHSIFSHSLYQSIRML